MGISPLSSNTAADSRCSGDTVNLTSYRIGETLVTQELWQAVMGSNPILFIIVFVFMFAAYRYHG